MKRRCLITGATGLVGAALVRSIADAWEVHACARRPETLPAGAKAIRLDLATDWSPGELPDRLDAVVHLAQGDGYRNFPESVEPVFRVNTASAMKLLDHASRAGAGTFILASTGGLYGTADRAFREEDPLAIDAPPEAGGPAPELAFYLRTRRAAETLAAAYAPRLNVVILRFFFVYGAGQKSSMLMPRLVASVRNGQAITLGGTDGLKMNPIHVDDAARAVAAALELEQSTIVNIAGPDLLTLRQVGEAIGGALGRRPVFSVDPSSPARHLYGDITRMSAVLGRPTVRFADGIRTLA